MTVNPLSTGDIDTLVNPPELPAAVEPDYWNVVFYPSESRLSRILLGRFQHVSAFTYVPGYRGWIVYDVQWSDTCIGMISHQAALNVFCALNNKCVMVKFDRQHQHLGILSRVGFYCVPAIKQLLGLSCVAVTPDGLYRHLMRNGGILLNEPNTSTRAAGRSGIAERTRPGASAAC